MKQMKVRDLVFLAILGAWAIVLRLFDFPVLPAAPFLRIDLSDLMVLIGLLVKGPIGLVSVAFIRDVANYLMQGGQGGFPIGVIMSFVASVVMFMPTHLILKYMKNAPKVLSYGLMSLGLTTFLTLSMAFMNYYVALPWYVTVLDFQIDNYLSYVLALIVPFNIIKGIIVSVGQFFVIEYISPHMIKRRTLYTDYLPISNPKPSTLSHTNNPIF